MEDQGKGNQEEPAAVYKNDPAWSKERIRRVDQLFDDYNDQRMSPEQALTQISTLIDETEAAVRGSEKAGEHRTVYEDSVLLQRLLYSYYHVSKKARR